VSLLVSSLKDINLHIAYYSIDGVVAAIEEGKEFTGSVTMVFGYIRTVAIIHLIGMGPLLVRSVPGLSASDFSYLIITQSCLFATIYGCMGKITP
jgi:hypothetical protein